MEFLVLVGIIPWIILLTWLLWSQLELLRTGVSTVSIFLIECRNRYKLVSPVRLPEEIEIVNSDMLEFAGLDISDFHKGKDYFTGRGLTHNVADSGPESGHQTDLLQKSYYLFVFSIFKLSCRAIGKVRWKTCCFRKDFRRN